MTFSGVRHVRRNQPISADAFNAVVDEVRKNRVVSSDTVRVSRTPSGTVIGLSGNLASKGGKGAVTINHPFKLYWVSRQRTSNGNPVVDGNGNPVYETLPLIYLPQGSVYVNGSNVQLLGNKSITTLDQRSAEEGHPDMYSMAGVTGTKTIYVHIGFTPAKYDQGDTKISDEESGYSITLDSASNISGDYEQNWSYIVGIMFEGQRDGLYIHDIVSQNITGAIVINDNDGATFIPHVDENGNLSWTNNKGLDNPTTVNIRGPQGTQGIQGPRGLQGVPGPRGTAGTAGPRGPQGIQGVAGPQGTAGKDGKDGVDGKDGKDGKDGAPGPQGIQGPPGPPGPPGPQGTAGKDGKDAVLPTGTLEKVDELYQWRVTFQPDYDNLKFEVSTIATTDLPGIISTLQGQGNKITSVEAVQSQQGTSLSNLQSQYNSLSSSLSSLSGMVSGHTSSIDSLNSKANSLQNSVNSLNTTTQSQATSLQNALSRLSTAEGKIQTNEQDISDLTDTVTAMYEAIKGGGTGGSFAGVSDVYRLRIGEVTTTDMSMADCVNRLHTLVDNGTIGTATVYQFKWVQVGDKPGGWVEYATYPGAEFIGMKQDGSTNPIGVNCGTGATTGSQTTSATGMGAVAPANHSHAYSFGQVDGGEDGSATQNVSFNQTATGFNNVSVVREHALTGNNQIASAAMGMLPFPARADHAHPLNVVDKVIPGAAADSYIQTINNARAHGTRNFYARVDHQHAMPSSYGTAQIRPNSTIPNDTTAGRKTDSWGYGSSNNGVKMLVISRVVKETSGDYEGAHLLYFREVTFSFAGGLIAVGAEIGACRIMA